MMLGYHFSMIRNYITIALRVLSKSKVYTAINVIGLVVAITSFTLIMLFVSDEFTYDTSNPHAERIYRIVHEAPENNPWLKDIPQLAAQLADEIPEIENSTRLLMVKGLVSYEAKAFEEERVLFADPSFFQLFPQVAQTGLYAFANENSVIVSEQAAVRYFGNENPIGKSIALLQSQDTVSKNFIITGMLGPASHSHITFDFLMPYREGMAFEDNSGVYTYLLLKTGTTPKVVQEKFKTLNAKHHEAWFADADQTISLQPITSIHLDSHLAEELEANGSRDVVYILTVTAFLILLIALINYINISLARSTKRAKEVGIRKVLGAYRSQVLRQFLLESVAVLVLATIIAFAATQFLLPIFNSFTHKTIELQFQQYLPILAGIILLSGLLASAYPALLLSGVLPAVILKDTVSFKFLQGTKLRSVLLTSQFAIATILLIITLTIWQQLHYIQNKDLGFEKDEVLVVYLNNTEAQQRYQALIQKFSINREILKVSAAGAVPGEEFPGWPYQLSAPMSPTGEEMGLGTTTLFVDEHYLSLMNITVLQGRSFDSNNAVADSRYAVIINVAFTEEYGWGNPAAAIGKTIQYHNPGTRTFTEAKVIGVVKDFHYQSFHTKIEPLVIRLKNPGEVTRVASAMTTLSLKISGKNIPSLITALEQDWKSVAPAYPFDFEFLDIKIQKHYENDQRLGQFFIVFSIISIIITCLGLLGITLLTVEQRTKEIGIRKILGATTAQLAVLLSKRFIKLLLFSIVVAIPAGYWIMEKWLQNFSYRITISWTLAAISVLAVGIITLLTVGYQSFKAARNNPVDALRSE